MPQLGLLLTIVAVLGALAGLAAGLVRPASSRLARLLQWLTFAAAAGAFGLLMAMVARADPACRYAVEHAAPRNAGLGYKLAAVWAGQAGGLLLWCVETALIGLLLRPAREPRAAAVLAGVEACLLSLVVLSNPFARPAPGTAGGLNPLLQHPMMMIHPPMVFLAYALLAVPYALTVGALADDAPVRWVGTVWPWVLVAWLTLTLANGFGADWAYKTFGWGGFWGWDPVENTSFVPWMLAAAAVHGLWLSRRRGRALRLAAVCVVAAFLSVLYGSYLARSGLLGRASVHAYVSGERLMQYALGTLLAGAAVVAVAVLALRWRSWVLPASPTPSPDLRPRKQLEAQCIDAMLAIAALVLVGISMPLAGLVPNTTAYNTALMPVAVYLLALLVWPMLRGLGPRLGSAAGVLLGLWYVAAAALALHAGFRIDRSAPVWIQALAAPALMLACVLVALRMVPRLARPRRPWRQRGAPLAHLGAATLLAGALMAGYGTRTADVYLGVGEEHSVLGQEIRALAVTEPSPGLARAKLMVDGASGAVGTQRAAGAGMEMRTVWIRRGLLRDVYITPEAVLAAPLTIAGHTLPAGAMVEVAVKPGMSLVWLGVAILAAGLLLALIGRLGPEARLLDLEP